MARKCFYSFHYKPDGWRASKVRNIGVIEGNQTVSDNDWEKITRGGDPAIERWIAEQMNGKSCNIVLIGAQTAGRKWINYEIIKAWNDKKGVFGIYIHNITNSNGDRSAKGSNPFRDITVGQKGSMADIVQTYDPPYIQSDAVYGYISKNVESWVDEAIKIRNRI
jgi:MTH538 TIR-like domain (DUF1863)